MARKSAWTKAHKVAFLSAFRLSGNVSAAALAADVDRRTPQRWRAEDPSVAEAWTAAEQEAADRLAAEARRQAEAIRFARDAIEAARKRAREEGLADLAAEEWPVGDR